MSKIKKKNEPQKMVEYTYRDMGQEYLMKKKVVRAVAAAIIMGIAAAVFLALYIEETKRVQETYRSKYRICLQAVSEDIEGYLKAEGDLDFRYRRITADMNSAYTFINCLDDNYTEQKKTITELYTVVLRYPEQTRARLETLKTAIDDILANLDKGYDEADAFVADTDKKGY